MRVILALGFCFSFGRKREKKRESVRLARSCGWRGVLEAVLHPAAASTVFLSVLEAYTWSKEVLGSSFSHLGGGSWRPAFGDDFQQPRISPAKQGRTEGTPSCHLHPPFYIS